VGRKSLLYCVIILITPVPPVAETKTKIMSSGKVLLGILAGVAVGATLGILFAPDKGSSTRKKISKKGDAYADELGEKFNEFVGGVKEKFETIKDEATRMGRNGKVKVEEAIASTDGSI
jgi:gas vesicle protein